MSTEDVIKIAVCDDMPADREKIIGLTERILTAAAIQHRISAYENGPALLEAIHNGAGFQLLLLDVMMGEMDGMALAAELRRQGSKTAIIFISGNREMAMYGYEVSALRFLGKPVEEEKLKEALLYCCKSWQEKKEILLPTDRGQYRISYADIQYVEAFDRGTRFVLAGESVECRLKFSQVQAMLPQSVFLMCHRGFIVNLSWVQYIRNYEFALRGGAIVPIGKNRYAEVYRKFVNYIAD